MSIFLLLSFLCHFSYAQVTVIVKDKSTPDSEILAQNDTMSVGSIIQVATIPKKTGTVVASRKKKQRFKFKKRKRSKLRRKCYKF